MARIGASGSGGSSGVAGNNEDVQYNNAGTLAGSDNFTFDGNYVHSGGFLGTNNLPNGIMLTIEPSEQYLVVYSYTIAGTLLVEGTFAVL